MAIQIRDRFPAKKRSEKALEEIKKTQVEEDVFEFDDEIELEPEFDPAFEPDPEPEFEPIVIKPEPIVEPPAPIKEAVKPKPKKKKQEVDKTVEAIESLTKTFQNVINNLVTRIEHLEHRKSTDVVANNQPIIHVHMPTASKIKREIVRNKDGMITGIVDQPEE